MRPIFVDINICNLKRNNKLIRNLCINKKIWLVLKANAYGHGLKNIYFGLNNNDIDGLAVLSIDEAILLRNLGFNKLILLLEGFFDLEELKLCLKFNFIIVIHSKWQIYLLKKVIIYNKIDVFLKINFNLNRLGFSLDKISEIFFILKNINNIRYISLMLHFSKSDNYVEFNKYIDKYIKLLLNLNLKFKYTSIFSSSGIIWHLNKIKSDWVRAGIILYGSSPTNNYLDIVNYGFKPVMTFRSEIICIQKVKFGHNIGYGVNYISDRDRFIGIVACGYADGYPRQLSNRSFVLIDNYFKCKVIGSIFMDMMIVDLLNNRNIFIGSKVELWGEYVCIDHIAKLANTINYHLMCSINFNRVKFNLIDS